MTLSQGLTPIPTRYKGYHFRSRLEARWAVFFDALAVAWEYEPEGFQFSRGRRYLPDFRLTGEYVQWVEVKGRDPAWGEIVLAEELSDKDDAFVFVGVGMPDEGGYYVTPDRFCRRADERTLKSSLRHLMGSAIHARFDEAVFAARSARFEYGECGAT